ncbi:STAS domain-containing protein [Streptomyces sp. TRM66268-LWL]|uniref:Anti-sigma factor antagonist n=1 Tax=Streptomyces polyasparticus TaxID=2767826 RepID=A0ABR7SVP5_9ACTN|nr:STAS domain-containing protein [Streptomyces polyasparticus]
MAHRACRGGTVLTIAGELDYDATPTVRKELESLHLETGDLLVLDLSHVSFCDSSGITQLIAARNTALGRRAGIALCGVTPTVARVLNITGLTAVLPSHDSPDEAFTAAKARGTSSVTDHD